MVVLTVPKLRYGPSEQQATKADPPEKDEGAVVMELYLPVVVVVVALIVRAALLVAAGLL